MSCMLCLRCKNEKFTAKVVATPQCFRGDEFTVKAPAMVCNNCKWTTVTDAQADELARITADEYRRRHGLLTSAEIVALRTKLKLSQRAFAKFLGVGDASVKRWETGFVQEKVYDELIRAKCAMASCATKSTDFAVSPAQIRFHTFTSRKPTVFPMRSQINAVCCAGSAGYDSRLSVQIKLSDGHPWRTSHYAANDPALPATA